jgi:hypothetical protein
MKKASEYIVAEGVVAKDDFGADFNPLPLAESYYPTRLEYFAGKALQGLVTGRSERDLRSVIPKSIALAKEMEDAVDSAQG